MQDPGRPLHLILDQHQQQQQQQQQSFVVSVGAPSTTTSPITLALPVDHVVLDTQSSVSGNHNNNGSMSEAGLSMRSNRAVTGGGGGRPLAVHSPPNNVAMSGKSVDFSSEESPSGGVDLTPPTRQVPIPGSKGGPHVVSTRGSPVTQQVSDNAVGGADSRGKLSPHRDEYDSFPVGSSGKVNNDESGSLLGSGRLNLRGVDVGLKDSRHTSLGSKSLTPRRGVSPATSPTSSRVRHGSVSGQLYFLASSSPPNLFSLSPDGGSAVELGNPTQQHHHHTGGKVVESWVLGELTVSEDWVHYLSGGEGESFAHATATVEAVNVLDYLNYSEHCCFELVIREQRRESARELRKKRSHRAETTKMMVGGSRSGSQILRVRSWRGQQQQHQQQSVPAVLHQQDRGGGVYVGGVGKAIVDKDAAQQRVISADAIYNTPGLFWPTQALLPADLPPGGGGTSTAVTPTSPSTTHDFNDFIGEGGDHHYTRERIVLCALDMCSMWEWLEALDQFLDISALTRSGISIEDRAIVPADPSEWAHPRPRSRSAVRSPLRSIVSADGSVNPSSPLAESLTPNTYDEEGSASTLPSATVSAAARESGGGTSSSTGNNPPSWGGAGVASGINPEVAYALIHQQEEHQRQIKQIKSIAMQLRRLVDMSTTHSVKPPKRSWTEEFEKTVLKARALIQSLLTTSLLASVIDQQNNPSSSSSVPARHMPASASPQAIDATKDIFTQLDRLHRAASRELTKTEMTLADLYPTKRECRGSRPADLSLAAYTHAYLLRMTNTGDTSASVASENSLPTATQRTRTDSIMSPGGGRGALLTQSAVLSGSDRSGIGGWSDSSPFGNVGGGNDGDGGGAQQSSLSEDLLPNSSTNRNR